ncbi:MAG: 50S ribosomal protein L25 [Silvibacterium sp.]
MNSQEVVAATPREGKFNKNAARRVRAKGRIPAVVYGAAEPSVAIEVDPKQILKILHSDTGHNSIFDLEINKVNASGGAKAKAMIVDWQYEPIKGSLLHIDLKRIAMDKAIRVEVPIQLIGIANGVKNQGGILDQVLREIEIECLPGDIPGHIDADVTNLSFGDVLRVADLPHSDKLKFLTDEDATVAHVTAIKEEVAPAADAVAADAAATPAEPEVAKKGKTETAEAAPAEKGAKK